MTPADKKPKPKAVHLRDVRDEDLPIFFEQQRDPEAIWMAAFTAEDPGDRQAFMAKWTTIRGDEVNVIQTILYDEQVAGHIVKFEMFGEPEVSYWIAREYWGNGVASSALALFLDGVKERPLFGRAARDNIASIRVMQKNGFAIIGQGKGFANARGAQTEEYILKLE